MKKAVGFDQKILLHQLDFMAREIPRTERRDELYEKVEEYLASDIAGAKSRLNARTILFKIWLMGKNEHGELQKQALELYDSVFPEERIALHWGLTVLAYPFFRDVAIELGQLYKLQDEVSSDQLNRKVKELYGERRRVEVAVSAVLTSLRSWEVIVSEKRNIQAKGKQVIIRDDRLKEWLAAVLIHALDVDVLPVEQLSNHALLFPFQLAINLDELSRERFKVIRQGVDMRMVGLVK
ncbi:MAG: hypothetical protein LRY73_20190 [Bacillus sp. (in: Bacteria)]|nr:hypothetical protein [Bacillus sp. (in: firmicutes)]